MKEFRISKTRVLKENLYCDNCRTWVYCPEMNLKTENQQGELVEEIGEGCLHWDGKEEFLECPNCKSRFYLI